ncbi:MAG: type IV pilus assembly protein PilM [Candidatus Omnitrophica bacterium]|nr:type IV pilus assembly protein PilM [Candidatus Omnitrophota bacterium]MDD5655314.1 type IV pilus assembly protein PilM [Candidatus Omnitrophota bacterium]
MSFLKGDEVTSIFSKEKKPKRISSLFSGFKRLPREETLKLVSIEDDVILKRFPAGLDFGATAIKLAQLGQSANGLQVVDLAIQELPLELSNSPKERKKALPEILKKMVREYKIKGPVVSAMPSSQVQMKIIKLPPMPLEEVMQAVKWEIQQTTTANIEELSFDYYLLNDENTITKDTPLDVLIISCLKKDVLELISLIQSADLACVAVETNPLAAVSALIQNSQIKTGEVALVLEFGGGSSSVNIIMNNKLYFSRELAVNGNYLTKAIEEHCQFSSQEAENIKKACGLAASETLMTHVENGTGAQHYDPGTERAIKVNEALWLHLENLIQEIDYTFKYFSYQVTQSTVSKFDKIILSGGSANLTRFPDYLATYLNTPVETANPFKNISMHPDLRFKTDNLAPLQPQFSVAIGLALRELSK